MSLPPGFNPNNMSFGNIPNATPVFEIPQNTSAYTSTSWSHSNRISLWTRFNRTITNIGNWFAEYAETVLGICTIILMVAIAIAAIVYVIGVWVDSGFWMALLAAFLVYIGCTIVWYIGAFIIVVVVNIVMYGLRLLFWNGWTFLIALILSTSFVIYVAIPSSSDTYFSQQRTEILTPTTQTYVCTAKSTLNVRNSPNLSSNTIGKLRNGDEVEVLEILDGFARIKYGNGYGYASVKYLKRK